MTLADDIKGSVGRGCKFLKLFLKVTKHDFPVSLKNTHDFRIHQYFTIGLGGS